jgi:hypothetical protein
MLASLFLISNANVFTVLAFWFLGVVTIVGLTVLRGSRIRRE